VKRKLIYKTKDLKVVILAQQFGNELTGFRVIDGYYVAQEISEDKMVILSHKNKIVANKNCEIEEDQVFVFNKMKLSDVVDNKIITPYGINKFEKETETEDDLSKIIENPKVELCK